MVADVGKMEAGGDVCAAGAVNGAGGAEAQQLDVAELQQSENGKGKERAKGQKRDLFPSLFSRHSDDSKRYQS